VAVLPLHRPDPHLHHYYLVVRTVNVKDLMMVSRFLLLNRVILIIDAPPMSREGSTDAKRVKLDRDRGRRPRDAGNRMLAGAMKAANDKQEQI
jgi:hypothetical protein